MPCRPKEIQRTFLFDSLVILALQEKRSITVRTVIILVAAGRRKGTKTRDRRDIKRYQTSAENLLDNFDIVSRI